MRKKLQVFISSTYADMLDERQAAVEAILRARHIPAGMELFASADESQMETIRGWIDDSDVFMLILGGRYGSIEPKTGKSYIEQEFDYAVKRKKPFFSAVIREAFLDSKVKQHGRTAVEIDNGPLMKSFREKVTSKICRFYGDLNELKLIILEALNQHGEDESLSGWIRGSEVIDPKAVLTQVERLQGENAALQLQLDALNALQTKEEPLIAKIRDETKKLLLAAAKADGRIIRDDNEVVVGGKPINVSGNQREVAKWAAGVEELLYYSLSERVTGRLSKLKLAGYELAEEIDAMERNADQGSSTDPEA